MTRSEIRRLLEARGIRLTKSLGQSFLHEAHALDRIVAAAELSGTEQVLEIGAGLGPLTERLVARAKEVLAIEKDTRLVRLLQDRFNLGQAPDRVTDVRLPPTDGGTESTPPRPPPANPGDAPAPVLQLIHADALAWLRADERDWSMWITVSNLPYAVASPILVELCRGLRSPKRIVVTLQFEVAQRLMSKPGTKEYGVLTLLVQRDYTPGAWFKIPAGSFFPRPKVDSACVVLERRPAMLVPDTLRPVFVRIVKRAFSQRRKMMLKLLKQDWPPDLLDEAYAAAGLSAQVRAEGVPLDQFVELTRILSGTSKGHYGG